MFNIGCDVNVLDGQSLNLELQKVMNEISTLHLRQGKKLYSTWDSLGLTDKASLGDIAKRMPLNTIFAIEALGGSSGATLPLPYITGGGTKSYMSGALVAIKNNEHAKVQFYWRNENYTCECSLNTYSSHNVTPWKFIVKGTITGITAGQFGSLLSNIWVPGTYYFTRSAMLNFTDKPSDNGGWLRVHNSGSTEADTRFYEFIENNPSCKVWLRNHSNPWVSVTPSAAIATLEERP